MDLATLPKVVLHDHLDGGLRPSTLLELATERHLDLTGAALAAGLSAARGDLVSYLSVFALTTSVMQTPGALSRVAAEAAEDLAGDGVVYAELRLAPTLHTAGGMTPDEVVDAVCGATAPGVELRWVLCALRDRDESHLVADVARRAAARGLPVVGVDLAGPELGHPCGAHADGLRSAGLPVTVHAGEADGPASVAEAVQACGARRVGHGVRLADALYVPGGPAPRAGHELVAQLVRDGVCLEVCPSSNVHTGVVGDPSQLAVPALVAAGLAVSLSSDNRLVSSTSTSNELSVAARAWGWGATELARTQLCALDAAFCPTGVTEALRGPLVDAWRSAGADV